MGASTNRYRRRRPEFVRLVRCAFPHCRNQVAPTLFACFDHWLALPIAHRKAIFHAADLAELSAAAGAARFWIEAHAPLQRELI